MLLSLNTCTHSSFVEAEHPALRVDKKSQDLTGYTGYQTTAFFSDARQERLDRKILKLGTRPALATTIAWQTTASYRVKESMRQSNTCRTLWPNHMYAQPLLSRTTSTTPSYCHHQSVRLWEKDHILAEPRRHTNTVARIHYHFRPRPPPPPRPLPPRPPPLHPPRPPPPLPPPPRSILCNSAGTSCSAPLNTPTSLFANFASPLVKNVYASPLAFPRAVRPMRWM